MELEKLWKTILSDVEKEVSKGIFVSFFKNTSLISLEAHEATISAYSAMHINMLQRKHQQLLVDLLKKHTGESVGIRFIVKTPDTKQSKKELPLLTSSEEPKPLSLGHLPRVRPDYVFETLAVSDSNNLAFESAKTVARNPGTSYNPLFIYGPVGVGKTHLMQAIANFVYSKNPDVKVVYITSEEFTNEVVEAIRGNDTARMKRKFRSANLLIIDDVQFIAGKEKVQEELFHTFNTLIDAGGQIVLSSDRPPSEIKKLEARLSSRFAGGLTVDIQAPDFELRTAIVLKKAEKMGVAVSIDDAKQIAERQQDVRSLEGALIRVITEATAKKKTLSEALAGSILNRPDEKPQVLHPDDIIKYTCEFYQIKPTQLKGPKRDASLVKARQITMYLLYNELHLTYVEIGNVLGGRDHTTIMHGVEKIGKLLSGSGGLQEEILGITRFLRG